MADTTYSTDHTFVSSTEELDDLRVSPAAHLAETMAEASAAGGRQVALRELPFSVQLGLRAQPESASGRALEDAFGLPLPLKVGEVSGDSAGLHILWLSPDEFLAVDVSRRISSRARPSSPRQDSKDCPDRPWTSRPTARSSSCRASKAREVLEKSCRADLHPRAFGVGTAIVTSLGPVPVILHHSSVLEYRVYPRASFADFTVRWLLDGMGEFLDGDSARRGRFRPCRCGGRRRSGGDVG
jgi:sarcosine oxidase subunit gamma